MVKGFTLLELLVVIAIVGLLSAVAVPAYRDYYIKAKISKAFNYMNAFKDQLSLQYQKDGAWPASISFGGHTLSNGF